MDYKITKIKMSANGTTEEHIEAVKCIDDGSSTEVEETVPEVIKYLQSYRYYVHVGLDEVDIIKSISASGKEYIRTKPDATKIDNLLSLPRYP